MKRSSIRSIRLLQIEQIILDKKILTWNELQEKFKISKNTLRRDIDEIIKKGTVKKVYGGVKATSENSKIVDFIKRNDKEKENKNATAKVAADYIQDNDIIFVDSGTTTVHIADYLHGKNNITLITNNIGIISKVARMKNVVLICLGGRINRRTYSFVGPYTLNYLQSLNIDKAFMAATGLTIKSGPSNSLYDENEIKSHVVKRAEQIFLLIDHTKFDKNTLLSYCDFKNIDYIITDKAPDEYKKEAKKFGVKLIESTLKT